MNNQSVKAKETTKLVNVCIVDDNYMAREVLTDQLSQEAYEIVSAKSGLELLDKFDALNPDVILMDVMMPQMSGYDVCQEIKQNPARQHIPIILVTALNSREDMLRGLDAGADEFLSKPVNGSELRARVRTMLRIKNQYDQLQTVMQLREDLSHMLIHDMRNPLTAATMYNDFLLKRGLLTPRDQGYASIVKNSLRDLAGFLDEVLTAAKMEEGMLTLSFSSLNLNHFVTNVAKNHREVAKLHGFQLTLDLPEGGRYVCLDEALFRRVLDNLLSNAFKFSLDQSEVTLRVRYPDSDSSFCLQVIDEGSGIAPEDYERIFDKYEVVEMKQREQAQVGLGLAFCKMVVEAHGGRIFVGKNKPQGATFSIEMAAIQPQPLVD